MKLKFTWQMSTETAREAVKRAGGDPENEGLVQGIKERSTFRQEATEVDQGYQEAGWRLLKVEPT